MRPPGRRTAAGAVRPGARPHAGPRPSRGTEIPIVKDHQESDAGLKQKSGGG